MSSPSISVMNCGKAFSLASHFAPVVIRPPIARELLNRRELHALRFIRDRFPVRPPGRGDAPAKIDERVFRNVDVEGADGVVFVAAIDPEESMPAAPAAAEAARKLRRVGDDVNADTIVLPVRKSGPGVMATREMSIAKAAGKRPFALLCVVSGCPLPAANFFGEELPAARASLDRHGAGAVLWVPGCRSLRKSNGPGGYERRRHDGTGGADQRRHIVWSF